MIETEARGPPIPEEMKVRANRLVGISLRNAQSIFSDLAHHS